MGLYISKGNSESVEDTFASRVTHLSILSSFFNSTGSASLRSHKCQPSVFRIERADSQKIRKTNKGQKSKLYFIASHHPISELILAPILSGFQLRTPRLLLSLSLSPFLLTPRRAYPSQPSPIPPLPPPHTPQTLPPHTFPLPLPFPLLLHIPLPIHALSKLDLPRSHHLLSTVVVLGRAAARHPLQDAEAFSDAAHFWLREGCQVWMWCGWWTGGLVGGVRGDGMDLSEPRCKSWCEIGDLVVEGIDT